MTENDVITAQLSNIAENIARMEKKIDSIEGKFDSVEARLREVEKTDAQSAAINQGKINAAHQRLDDHAKRLAELERFHDLVIADMAGLKTRMNVVGIIGAAILGSVVMLLFELLKAGHIP